MAPRPLFYPPGPEAEAVAREYEAARHAAAIADLSDRGVLAVSGPLRQKFLEGILVALKNARLVSSQRGREGGYRLRRPPAEILIGEVVRTVDGPLAPFGDAVELACRVKTEPRHAGLFDLFLDVRNAAAAILDHTSLRDLVERNRRIMTRRGRLAKERR